MKRGLIYYQLTAFIFLAAFLAQTFSRTFVVADYYTNTSKYIRNCENKARPQLKCHGRCQMMKKLQQEEKKDQENPERKVENKNEVLPSSRLFFFSITLPIKYLLAKTKYPSMANGKSIDRSFDIFHPPQTKQSIQVTIVS
ncbi:MAG: hypothetical protein PHD73_10715 [Sediminibacterium sp.]|nr:hypothetical protein [Sediminibacterium sp.]